MRLTSRIRMALFRLNCTLQDPDNWIGYAIDPAVTERPCFWLHVPGWQLFWSPPLKFAKLRQYNQDDCPACHRIHFPWCGEYGNPPALWK
jgi:hypothetical protein